MAKTSWSFRDALAHCLRANNPETAELLSRMTGTMTVVKAAFNYSGNRLSPMLGQVSTNVEEIERPLMTPAGMSVK